MRSSSRLSSELWVWCFAVTGTLAMPVLAQAKCGYMRWPVKTGSDADVGQVDPSHVVATSVSEVDSWPAPATLPQDARVAPHEDTVYQISGTLLEVKHEGDSDYHLLIRGPSGNTLIAEIPDPACVSSSSPFLSAIQQARQAMDEQLAQGNQNQTLNIPVQVTGVGFFDFIHGQTDVAPNGFEIHPVLNVQFQ